MTDKSARWAFTAYEPQYKLLEVMPPGVAEWGWQEEQCPTTNRKHYQGFMRLTQQQRFAWMKKTFPGLHVEIAKDWNALINYCMKVETRVDGGAHAHAHNDIPTKFAYAEELARRIPTNLAIQYTEEILEAVEILVRTDIINGRRGVEWIAANPDWKVVWKSYGREMFLRSQRQTDRQTETKSPLEYTHAPQSPPCPQASSLPPPPSQEACDRS